MAEKKSNLESLCAGCGKTPQTCTCKAKHTPGPWHAGDMDSLCPTVRDQKDNICLVNYRASDDAADANARLIAAAPQLLEALEAAQAYIRTSLPIWAKAEDLPPVMHVISTAIRSAKGEL